MQNNVQKKTKNEIDAAKTPELSRYWNPTCCYYLKDLHIGSKIRKHITSVYRYQILRVNLLIF